MVPRSVHDAPDGYDEVTVDRHGVDGSAAGAGVGTGERCCDGGGDGETGDCGGDGEREAGG